jgi:outer membrane lipoprotein SlyB
LAIANRRSARIHCLRAKLPLPHHADNKIEDQTMIHKILLAGLTMMLLAGCVPANSGYVRDDYDYDRGHREYRRGCENCGQILRIESIGQRGTSGGGAVLGAIIGGALGNQVGKGDGRKAATIAGAVAGGVIGNEVERDGQRRSYFRILVRMDSGRTRAFEQYRIYDLRRGDRVYIDNGLVVPGY